MLFLYFSVFFHLLFHGFEFLCFCCLFFLDFDFHFGKLLGKFLTLCESRHLVFVCFLHNIFVGDEFISTDHRVKELIVEVTPDEESISVVESDGFLDELAVHQYFELFVVNF